MFVKCGSYFKQIFTVSYIKGIGSSIENLSRNECGYLQEWVKYLDYGSS